MRKVEAIGRFSICENRGAFYLRWWEPDTKKTVARLLGGDALADVRAEALDLVKRLSRPEDLIGSADPFFEEVWVLYQARQKVRISAQRYYLNEKRWPLYYERLAKVRVSRLHASLVTLKNDLIEESKLSPQTISDIIAIARAAVKHAIDTGDANVKHVPLVEVEGYRRPEDRKRKGRLLEIEEIGKLIDACDHRHILHLVLLHIGTVARSGSLLELTAAQVSRKLGVIDLLQIGDVDDDRKRRAVVPISGPMWWVLDECEKSVGRDGLLIHYRSQGLLAKNSTQIVQRLVKRAGIKDDGPIRVNFYSFRHTLIDMLDPLVPGSSLSMFAGHRALFSEPRERQRMHEAMGARTTELYKTQKLTPLEPIRRAMDETIWPEIQAVTKTDLRLGAREADATLMQRAYPRRGKSMR